MRDKSQRGFLFKHGVLYLFLLALLIRHYHFFATLIVQVDRAPRSLNKMFGCYLAAVDESQREPLSDHRAQFFHEVQTERWPARTEGMEKSHLRVQTDPFCSSHAVTQ